MKRNGKIDLLRFVYACIVFCRHFRIRFDRFDNLFEFAAMGADYFFILSGFFVAESVHKASQTNEQGEDTFLYIGKKIRSFLYEYVISYILVFILHFVYLDGKRKLHDIIVRIFRCIPDFLLLREIGWAKSLLITNDPTWYLSAMVISLMVVYPLCRKSEWFRDIGSFFLGAILIGTIRMKYVSLVGPHIMIFGDLFFKGFVRGFGEICLGVFCHELYMKVKERDLTTAGKILFTVLEILHFAISIYVCILSHKGEYNIIGLYAMMILIILAFSKKSYLSDLFDNPVCFYLGRLSLSIYLSHMSVIYLFQGLIGENKIAISDGALFAIMAVCALLVAVAVDLVSKAMKKLKISRLFIRQVD